MKIFKIFVLKYLILLGMNLFMCLVVRSYGVLVMLSLKNAKFDVGMLVVFEKAKVWDSSLLV